MTRDEVIALREQADEWAERELQCVGEYHPDFHTVSDERFAALVAAHKEKEMQERIDALFAMYEQACQQRDQLMDMQSAQIAAMRGRTQ